ncbi:MAG: DNA polymerase III subunit epsilon, partial [Succinivibrio dextrinosolvens]|nr:DNA polymerase III subunit epsilon [Succinivibrio dextrinosolvens]
VARFLTGRPLVVAHNAAFDRPFFEKRFKSLTTLSWACSLKEIPWKKLGYSSAKLEFLNMVLGYFYDAHRAYVDCLALLWIMYKVPAAFSELVTSALSCSYRVIIRGNTFKFKDNLKEKGFRFDGGTAKTWSRYYQDEDEASRVKQIIEDTYKDGSVDFDIRIVEYKAKTRYKLENN